MRSFPPFINLHLAPIPTSSISFYSLYLHYLSSIHSPFPITSHYLHSSHAPVPLPLLHRLLDIHSPSPLTSHYLQHLPDSHCPYLPKPEQIAPSLHLFTSIFLSCPHQSLASPAAHPPVCLLARTALTQASLRKLKYNCFFILIINILIYSEMAFNHFLLSHTPSLDRFHPFTPNIHSV